MAVSPAQRRAIEKYDANNPEKTRHRKGKSAAKSFIRNRATLEDLAEIKALIATKEAELNDAQD
ncbi:hypothetical protein [Lactiplantibacillus fabifermentans]|uniref:Uncharacterized protein n=2 Tax=Lactiplantibacillus fabifermentans TaxID=483011 RepID=A0A0R2NTH4_9LACO|nr:hypothetical protein [Lactiplantibacillus fabifermentans]ETY75639.1 hypothetical protein LFAB_00320 [Lactiplantibacillus fabifermentans T30PCM01]KRO26586.1 hypothetical protein DY78_GL000804 [Lactiplantibacillus fabifermentans DSM 21115]